MPNDFDNAELTSVPTPDKDEALQFQLNGYTLGWRASGLALERAASRGVEVGELLADLQMLFAADISEEDLEDMGEEEIEEALEMQASVSDFLAIVAKLAWVGSLHFNAGVELDAIRAILDTSNVGEVPVELMLGQIFPALENEDETVGKGQEGSAS